MTYLLLATAFALSSVAAWYSIVGLMTIFSGAAVSIAVMGSVLEVAKLTIASWLYRNWKTTSLLLKSYFVVAIIILMVLTSMGIFGYLSKAHSDQNLLSGDVISKIAILDERIKNEKENIDANRKIITQLDLQVNEAISRTSATDTTGRAIDRSVSIRRTQTKERQAAQEAILSSQAKVARLNEERAPIAAQVRQVEAEVGPIKYIAALIYGDSLDPTLLEKAVRLVILLIVFVFDPLAVLMFIAYNQSVLYKHPSELQDAPQASPVEEVVEALPEVEQKIEWERDRVLVPASDN